MKTKQLFLIVSLVWGICFNSFNAISSEMEDTGDICIVGATEVLDWDEYDSLFNLK